MNHSDYIIIDFYEVHAIPAEGSCTELNMSRVIVVVDGRSTRCTVSSLEENTTYIFTVVAVNGIGRSNHSEEQHITTLPSGTNAVSFSTFNTCVHVHSNASYQYITHIQLEYTDL